MNFALDTDSEGVIGLGNIENLSFITSSSYFGQNSYNEEEIFCNHYPSFMKIVEDEPFEFFVPNDQEIILYSLTYTN